MFDPFVLDEYHLILLSFYLIWSAIFLVAFWGKFRRWSVPIVIGLIVFGSEYWEIPCFIAANLGIGERVVISSFALTIHHFNRIVLFGLLVYMSKIKFSFSLVYLLLAGIYVNWFILVPYLIVPFWVPRSIGLFILGLVFYVGGEAR